MDSSHTHLHRESEREREKKRGGGKHTYFAGRPIARDRREKRRIP